MPALIRLVHGNVYGILKLIKEFRAYWQSQNDSGSQQASTSESQSGSPQSQGKDSPQPGTSMEVDSSEEKGESNPMKKQQEIFSKQQLKKKIQAIAVREKRPDYKKTCWYVKDDVLKQYEMGDLQIPNTWGYVCLKEPKLPEEKVAPKVEEIATSGRNTPNIMQFAQPMSPAMILAQAALKDQARHTVGNDVPSVAVPEEAPVPSDQRTIMDMFSPASKKVNKNKLSQNTSVNSQTVHTEGVSKGTSSTPTVSQKTGPKTNTSPDLNIKTLFSVKPVGQKPVIKIDAPVVVINDEEKPNTSAPKTPVSEKKAGYSVIDTVLTSPELMKGSPKNDGPISAKKQVPTTGEPMDVDVIVLD